MHRAAKATPALPLAPALLLALAMTAAAPASEPAEPASDADAQQSEKAEARVDQWIDQLNAPEHSQREQATAALMQSEALTEQRLMQALRSASSPERRHRLLRVAMHRYFRQLDPERGNTSRRQGSLGIHTPAQSVVRPSEHPKLDHPAMMVTMIYPGFPAFVHLRPGDLIYGIEGEPFATNFNRDRFGERIKEHAPGQHVSLLILRNGERIEVPVRLADYARLTAVSEQLPQRRSPDQPNIRRRDPRLYTPWLKHRQELLGSEGGAKVVELDSSGSAEDAAEEADAKQTSPSNDGTSD